MVKIGSVNWNDIEFELLLEDHPQDILLNIEGQHLRFQKNNALDGALAAMNLA